VSNIARQIDYLLANTGIMAANADE